MKRIAAGAALIVTMLAVPTTAAMASTGGSGSDRPWPSQSLCPQPSQHHHRHHQPAPPQFCPLPSKVCLPGHAFGQPRAFTFDVASGSSTVYEVSGPILASAEEFSYNGSIYTIWTVNPGADSFTMSLGETLFVNEGPAITNATGYLLCSA